MKQNIEKQIIKIGIKIARSNQGGMFVLGDNLKNYKFMVNQDIKPFNIMNNPKTAQSLALQDGFVWIDSNGIVKGYGMAIKNISPILNFGTRHASASACSKQNKVFLISQEEKKIKIFINGKIVMQIDAMEKGVERKISETTDFLDTIVDTLASFGIVTGATVLGITILPGIVVFGSSFALIKLLRKIK